MRKIIFSVLFICFFCISFFIPQVATADGNDAVQDIGNDSNITSNVTLEENIARISGTVDGIGGSTQVSIMVGDVDNIIKTQQLHPIEIYWLLFPM